MATHNPSTAHLSAEGGTDYAEAAAGTDRRRRMKAQQASRPDPNKSIEAGSGVTWVSWPPDTGANAMTLVSVNRFSKVQGVVGATIVPEFWQLIAPRIKSSIAEEPGKAFVNAASPVATTPLRVALKCGFADPFATTVHVTLPVSLSPSPPSQEKNVLFPCISIGKTVPLPPPDAVIGFPRGTAVKKEYDPASRPK
jgi:hypothetical protein